MWGNHPLPDNAVFVSFDDGYRNNLTFAAPLLKKYDIPAVVFVTSDYIETENKIFPGLETQNLLMDSPLTQIDVGNKTISLPQDRYERSVVCRQIAYQVRSLPLQERRQWLEHLRRCVGDEALLHTIPSELHELQGFLTWNEVRELRKFAVDIGCHTVSHPVLADLPPDELHDELQLSKAKIEQELGSECDTLAYPFGSSSDYSEAVISKTKELGFRLAFTLTNKRNDLSANGTSAMNPLEIHRICITQDLTLPSFKAIISGIRGN